MSSCLSSLALADFKLRHDLSADVFLLLRFLVVSIAIAWLLLYLFNFFSTFRAWCTGPAISTLFLSKMLQRFHGRPNWVIPALAQSTKFIIFITALLILLAFGILQTTETISYPAQFAYGQAEVPATPEELAANSTLGVRMSMAPRSSTCLID